MPAPIIEFIDVNVSIAGASVEKFSFGTLLGAFAHAITANRQDGPYFSQQEAVDAGFTLAATPNIFNWIGTVFSQENGVDQVLVGRRDAADLDWTTAMDAILADNPDWYLSNIEGRADADILELGAWTEPKSDPPKVYMGQSSDSDFLNGVGGNIGELLKAFNYNRSALWYHVDDTGTNGYLDGGISSKGGGLQLDAVEGVGIWAYQQLSGVAFDAVTGVQATAIYFENGNLFGRNKGASFTSKGTMASGRFIDVATTSDWVKQRSEEAWIALAVGIPTKIPYTNGGINLIVGALLDVLNRGVSFGHFSPDVRPKVFAPDISEVSDADKAARELTLRAEAVLSGAVQKVTYNITLSF